jgi:hypothetical protein
MQFKWVREGEARGAIMRRYSQPKDLIKLAMTEGRIFICLLQLLTASAAFAQNAHPGPSGSPYVVDGLALGARIDFGSPIYRSYQCSPSEQFPQFTRCQRTQKQQIVGSHRSIDSTSSILHSPDGTAVYINRYIAPGVFDRNQIQSEINRLSSKFGERANEMRMPQREGVPNAVIASWGKVHLEQLDADGVSILASGQSPRKGLLIDYLGDLRRSAQLGLPIYSLSGGAGYLWSASIDRNGGSHLRFLTVDASTLTATRGTQLPSREVKEPEKMATESATADAESARVETARTRAEPDASALTATRATQLSSREAKEPEKIATESATADAESARVETERTRVELPKDEIESATVAETVNTDAGAVENVLPARGAVGLIAFLIITAVLLLVCRATARARRRQVYNSKMHP